MSGITFPIYDGFPYSHDPVFQKLESNFPYMAGNLNLNDLKK